MILLTTDANMLPPTSRLAWDRQTMATVASVDAWSRASRRLVQDLLDEQGHCLPLREELWVTVYPPRSSGLWRAEADSVGPAVVGRGETADEAVADWRTRFRMTTQRYLEMRPFEMQSDDWDLWDRIQTVFDVAKYKATKPLVIRQLGKIHKAREGVTVVEWEDGARERVDPRVFDEAFSRFRAGQPFEAIVTREPLTFQIIRADAVRRLKSVDKRTEERSKALWSLVVGTPEETASEASESGIDEGFWLTPRK